MEYNFDEYIRLLDYQQTLNEQNKYLKIEDYMGYLKLLRYSSRLSEYLYWLKKDEYLQLIKDFLDFKINAEKFVDQFSKMVRAINEEFELLSKNYKELKNIQPNSMSLEFGTWILEIYLSCNEFYPDFREEERSEIPIAKTEEQLRDTVKNLLPEIQKYFEI